MDTGSDALTSDGRIVHIRPVVEVDAVALNALYQRGSPASLRMRFFSVATPSVIAAEVARLTGPPHDGQRGAVLAELGGVVVGVASYAREAIGTGPAEFAVYVDDEHGGRGIGTLLLEHLVSHARQRGIGGLTGEVMSENERMLRVATGLTAARLPAHDVDGVFDIDVDTAAHDAALLAADRRDRVAERASLRPLLSPTSVAVVGAGRTPGGIGNATLRSILEYGFLGPVYAVNPHADLVEGVPAVPSLADVPGVVDLAVIAVAAPQVASVLVDAVRAGVRAAAILNFGFGEDGRAGRARLANLVRFARGHGIRLVGPSCIGVINTDPRVRLNASFAHELPATGGLAVASQSGAVGLAVLDHAARTGCGISTFVSLGNEADVSGNDLLQYWYDDPSARAVALHVESFGNPRRFARLVRALGRRKPVLAVKSGRSTAGERPGTSHTAAAAAPDVAVDSLFAQAGVVRTDSLGDLLDAARLLTDQPLPAGARLAIVGNENGVNVLAADAAEPAGLTLPSLSPTLRARLARLTPDGVAAENPLDLGAAATPRAVAEAFEAIAGSGEVDSIVVVAAAARSNDVPGILAALGPLVDRHDTLAVAGVVLGRADLTSVGTARRAPVFDLPERAVRALGHVTRYAAWKREPLGAAPELSGVDAPAARAAVAEALAGGGGWQDAGRVARILAAYGIPLIPSATAASAGEAVAAADRLGYPVAVKAADPALVRRSDIGAVRLDLPDADAVQRAYQELACALDEPTPAVLVQPMAYGQIELVAGIVHDPLFGSLVMSGLGGIHTDLLADRAFRLVPLTDLDATRMWRSLRCAPLLTGYRGAAPVDTTALEDLLARLGRLAEDVPEIAELDLNPVLAGSTGVIVIDAKLRLATVGDEPDPNLRALPGP